MTKKYTDTLMTDIATVLADNQTQQISAADVRQALIDIVDSLRPAWSALLADHTAAAAAINLTSSWQTLTGTGFWTAKGDSAAVELEALQTAGQVDIKFGGWNHLVRGQVNFEAPSNTEIQMSIGVDGSPIGTIASVNGAGTGRIVQLADWALTFAAAGSKIALLMRAPAGNQTIQLRQAQLYAELTTTRYS
jgi:hypothetical protein